MMVPTPRQLGMQPVLSFTGAPQDKSFVYRRRVLRVIDTGQEDEHRFRKLTGPFLYAVVDSAGITKYMGRSLEKRLSGRWERRGTIHHKATRDHIIAALDAKQGSLWLWSATVEEIRGKLPAREAELDRETIARNLEALWLSRWRRHLWNAKEEPVDPEFSDGEYWR